MSYESTILAEASLQSYWQLSETAGSSSVADSKSAISGTPANVTLGSTPLLGSDTTTSASFNGTNSGINMADHYGFTGTASFSIECWVRTPSSLDSAQHHIVSKERNDGGGVRQGWHLVLNTSNQFMGGRWHGTNLNVDVANTTALSGSTVYYVVYTYDGTNSRVYVNAGAAAVGAADANAIAVASPTTANFGVGAMDANNFYFLNGNVGHVAVYNAVLNATQISAHYAAAFPPPVAPVESLPVYKSGGWASGWRN